MHIAYTQEQENLGRELRAYYRGLLTPEIRRELQREHGAGETMRSIVRQMGDDGWLGIGWPTEAIGKGLLEHPDMPLSETLAMARCFDEIRAQIGLTIEVNRR